MRSYIRICNCWFVHGRMKECAPLTLKGHTGVWIIEVLLYIYIYIYIYSRTSIIQTPVCPFNVKGVQIN